MRPTLLTALAVVATLSLAVIALGTAVLADDEEADEGDPIKNSFGPRGVVTVVDDENNIAASELIGTWVPAWEVSTSLVPPGKEMGGKDGFRQIASTYTFEESQVATERIQAALGVTMAKLREEERDQDKIPQLERACQALYLTGRVTVTVNDEEVRAADFALVNLRGNPHVVYLESDGDFESQNIMLARDADGDADVLWIGGDFNNQDMSPMIRKEHAETLRVEQDDDAHVKQLDLRQHLLSQSIWGSWNLNQDLTGLIAGEPAHEDVVDVTFQRDAEATDKIIAALEEMADTIKGTGAGGAMEAQEALRALSRVYASGRMTTTMTEGESVTEFALVNMYGSPMIAWNRKDGKVQLLRIQYVHDADGDNDLLFMATDLPDDTPQAFMRKRD